MAFRLKFWTSICISITLAALTSNLNAFGDPVATALPPSPNFVQIENWIQTKNIKSVEDLLSSFASADLSKFALVYSSRSSQGANPANPRTIVFNPTSNLTFAFNGGIEEQGYNRVEFMQFQSDTKKFELHEVTFDGVTAKISNANPATCLQCHGSEPHPIWDSYFFWPGVYGSEDAQAVGAEETNLGNWYDNRKNNPRYATLYSYAHSVDAFRSRSPEGHPLELGAQNLGMYLSAQNFQAIIKNLQEDPKMFPFRYALLAAGICTSEPFLDFISSDAQKTAYKDYASETTEVAQGLQSSFLQRFDRSEQVNGRGQHGNRVKSVEANLKSNKPDPQVDGYPQITNYRYVVDNFADATPNWSLEFVEPGSNRKTYAMNDGFVLIPGLKDFWATVLNPAWDADLYQIFSSAPKYPFKVDEKQVCGKLKDKSLVALNGWHGVRKVAQVTPVTPSVPASNTALIFKSCLGCHASGGTFAPQIPFGDSDSFKTKLNETGYAHGALADEILFRISATDSSKMPPGQPLAAGELQAIKDYLSNREPASKKRISPKHAPKKKTHP